MDIESLMVVLHQIFEILNIEVLSLLLVVGDRAIEKIFLLLMEVDDSLFYSLPTNQSHNSNLLFLSYSVYSFYSLLLNCWVPPRIYQKRMISSC